MSGCSGGFIRLAFGLVWGWASAVAAVARLAAVADLRKSRRCKGEAPEACWALGCREWVWRSGAEDGFEGGPCFFPGELLDEGVASAGELEAQGGIVDEAEEVGGEGGRVFDGAEEGGLPVDGVHRGAGDVGGDEGCAALKGFGGWEGEAFGPAGREEDGGVVVKLGEELLRGVEVEGDAFGRAMVGWERPKRVSLRDGAARGRDGRPRGRPPCLSSRGSARS